MNPVLPISIAIVIGVFLVRLNGSAARKGSPYVKSLYVSAGRRFSIPPLLLSTIAERESGGNPRATPNPGSDRAARGLMQITGPVREEYNRRLGKNLSPSDLWDPSTNVLVGAWLLSSIISSYKASGIPELMPDWNSRNWIDLLVLGYGAGYSSSSGVVYLAREMNKLGVPVTLDHILEWGPAIPGTYSQVFRPAKVAWCRKTAGIYFNSRN